MGHYGKHKIDPETGLCEICDQDAIHELRQGKQPGRQLYYKYHDGGGGNSYRSNHVESPYTNDRYAYEVHDDSTPRYGRKTVYPTPTVRPRRVIYEQPTEQPIVIRRKIVRREPPPPPLEQVFIHRSAPRPKTFYYVDKEGQMLPQDRTPPPEPSRRYIVQNRQPPPTRTVRVVRQHAQTPPPPATEVWHTGQRRQIKSDTEIVERQQRMRRDDTFYDQTPLSPPSTPKKAEMYYIESILDNNRHSPLDTPGYMTHDRNSPPPKMIYQGDENRRHRKVEPLERRIPNEPEPTVVRRVYKKLPPGKYEPPNDEHIPNGNQPRTIRKNGRNQPPPRQYVSSPEFHTGNNRSPESTKNPAIFYIRSVDDYE